MIAKLFEITNFIDKARWGNKDNYNLINFYRTGLSADAKILTHWICYITDRQMPFERIWDIGGFIFSEMVEQLMKTRDLGLLNPVRPDISFFIQRAAYPDKRAYRIKQEDEKKFIFVSHQTLKDNSILLAHDLLKGTRPYFIPRYYPSDYMSILSTFVILRDYDFSLIKYVIGLSDRFPKDDDFLPKLLFGLYLLSYYEIGQPSNDVLGHFDSNIKKAERRKKAVDKILCVHDLFQKEFDDFKVDGIFKQKRAWCSLRDFLKSPEFSGYFFEAMKEKGFRDRDIFRSGEALKYLELPGDVWNNNSTFRKCLLHKTAYEDSPLSLSMLLRKIFNENKAAISEGYPEQFDISFDFVPRMCELENCKICPYGLLNGRAVDFRKVCIHDLAKYCPVVLGSCNYKMDCHGDGCILLKYAQQ